MFLALFGEEHTHTRTKKERNLVIWHETTRKDCPLRVVSGEPQNGPQWQRELVRGIVVENIRDPLTLHPTPSDHPRVLTGSSWRC